MSKGAEPRALGVPGLMSRGNKDLHLVALYSEVNSIMGNGYMADPPVDSQND